MSFYLLEIACEELPAAFVTSAAEYAGREAEKQLRDLKLSYGEIRAGATARRIYLYISGLPEKQEDYEELLMGPPASAAFNPDGFLTAAGEKFVKAKGLTEYKKQLSPKGEYLAGVKKHLGKRSETLMAEIASRLILSFPAGKSMRWGELSVSFSRPIRYVLSIFDGVLLPLDIKELAYTNEVSAHRFLSPAPVKVSDFSEYKKALADGYVIADIDERRKRIQDELKALSEKNGYAAEEDGALIAEIANLTEYPLAVEGSFDTAFLELPPAVLAVTMKKHQKFLPVYKDGKLLPKFIGVSNMLPSGGDFSLIRKGYERVLSARLNDALFFYRNDRKVPLKDQAEKLKRIVYFEKLGTLYDKTERIAAIALYLGELFNIEREETEQIELEEIKLAAGIAKADLASEMVFELPELQGTMGRYYALYQGYSEKVAIAVEEHYLPRYAGGPLPQTPIGGVLAVADRIDTIAAAFSVGMIPSGSLDPYGLRRAAIGIINILEGFSWHLDIKNLIGFALERVNNNTAETAAAIIEYILSRQKQILAQSGVSGDAYDTAAALKDDLIDIRIRAEIIAREKENAKFASVTASYKRINNILKKAETLSLENAEVNTSLFESGEERNLFDMSEKRSAAIKTLTSQREWAKTLYELEAFAEPLNAYFVSIMIMHENPLIRANRLSTLSKLKQLFNSTGLT